MEFEWRCTTFSEMTVHELYEILRLRAEVFIVEQSCVFQDLDNKDQHCYHLAARHDKNLVAYARLVPPGISYNETSIGRIITSPLYRGVGAGKQLLQNAILKSRLIFNEKHIKIGAQLYLKKFYESFGFQQVGAGYIEDGIAHIHMLKI